MATKVKGDAIKEGSIPFSALSTEVKNKIENAGGGADWNAQEGEAGYIANKPCFSLYVYAFETKTGLNQYFNTDFNPDQNNGSFSPLYDMCVKNINAPESEPVILCRKGDLLWYGDGRYVEVEDKGVVLDGDNETGDIFINSDDDFEVIFMLDSKYVLTPIPEEVVKTTPQKLSDTEKNQVLANLGIDPVVWKYMCDPYIVENGVPLPEELRNIIEYETGGLKRIALKIFLIVDYDGNFHTITHMSDNTIHSSFASFVYNKEAGCFEEEP